MKIAGSPIIALALLACSPAYATTPALTAQEQVEDVDWLVDQIGAHYAYLPERMLDLGKLRAIYRAEAFQARSNDEFLAVIERLVAELHDHHATLGANTASSPRLVPTGADIWAEMSKGHAIVLEVRVGSAAERAGIHAGDEIVRIGQETVGHAIAERQPQAAEHHDMESDNYALRALLAGTHDRPRAMTVRHQGRSRTLRLGAPIKEEAQQPPVTSRMLDHGIGYIRLENGLGDSDTVTAFDDALARLATAKAFILDLRNTPSGGNTEVAEPLMGRFFRQRFGYQRVFDPHEGKVFPRDGWTKVAEPRAPFVGLPLVVLVDHWTGSMGEGMAIGFDGLTRATVVGTRMAGLCGGTGEFDLPHSKVPVHIPVERLYQLNGTGRENYMPHVEVNLAHAHGADAILARGIALLEQQAGAP